VDKKVENETGVLLLLSIPMKTKSVKPTVYLVVALMLTTSITYLISSSSNNNNILTDCIVSNNNIITAYTF
jgi:hypothetical protein